MTRGSVLTGSACASGASASAASGMSYTPVRMAPAPIAPTARSARSTQRHRFFLDRGRLLFCVWSVIVDLYRDNR